MPDLHDLEIDRNLFAFLPKIPSLIERHFGQYALLKDQQIVSLHERLSEALDEAETCFADGLYSIQQVTDKPVELGFFSHAADQR